MNLELAIRYLLDQISLKDRSTFESWLEKDPSNRAEFDNFRKEWETSEKAVKEYSPDAVKAWEKIMPQTVGKQQQLIPAKSMRLLTRWNVAAAVIVFLIALSATAYFTLRKGKPVSEFTAYTTTNNLKKLILADGSKVWLNTASELQIPNKFSKHSREVFLKGEAFFEIRKDPSHPFRVNTDNTTTQVLGTAFDLKTAVSGDKVSLVRGKITFYPRDQQQKALLLAPGYSASFNPGTGEMKKNAFQNLNFAAWKTGDLHFKNTPLPEVLKTIATYYHLKVGEIPEKYKSLSLTADFHKQPLDKVLSILELTWKVHVYVENNTLKLKAIQ